MNNSTPSRLKRPSGPSCISSNFGTCLTRAAIRSGFMWLRPFVSVGMDYQTSRNSSMARSKKSPCCGCLEDQSLLSCTGDTRHTIPLPYRKDEEPMDAATFVEQLGAANQEILDRLAPAETLIGESGGDLRIENLLKIALKNEFEATELAARWLVSTDDID